MNALHWPHALSLVVCVGALLTGCHTMHRGGSPRVTLPAANAQLDDTPRELDKAMLPTYRIEPPDVLTIEALQVIPKTDRYKLRPLDLVNIAVDNAFPDFPISAVFAIEPGGFVDLGEPYGPVRIGGLTATEAEQAISDFLRVRLTEPSAMLTVVRTAGNQDIAGDHLVGPDGTVRLGSYGSVPVVGLTMDEAEAAIEQFLSDELDDPQIALDVVGYNSKVYYVVTEGAGLGDTVAKFPITGNETVLDAISNVTGLTQASSKRIWINRPTRDPCKVQVLPVDWTAITAMGAVGTNYQLLPGDRVFVAENKMVAFDSSLGKLLAPFERVMGFSLLGVGTVSRFSGSVLRQGGIRGFSVIP